MGVIQEGIARKIKGSQSVISKFLKDPENYGMKKSPGRPKKLNKRDISHILRLASNNGIGSSRIQGILKLDLPQSTVQRAIKRSKFQSRLLPNKNGSFYRRPLIGQVIKYSQ